MKGTVSRLLIVFSPFAFLLLHPTFGVISEERVPQFLGSWRVYGLCGFLIIAGGFTAYRKRRWAVGSMVLAGVFILWTL
jgi:hypothetical protein